MFKNFADGETARIWSSRRSRRLPIEIQPIALRKLRMLNQARTLIDPRVPAGNRLEVLRRRAARAVQHQDQSAVADLLHVAGKERSRVSRPSTNMTDKELLSNPHPGEILAKEFMQPLG